MTHQSLSNKLNEGGSFFSFSDKSGTRRGIRATTPSPPYDPKRTRERLTKRPLIKCYHHRPSVLGTQDVPPVSLSVPLLFTTLTQPRFFLLVHLLTGHLPFWVTGLDVLLEWREKVLKYVEKTTEKNPVVLVEEDELRSPVVGMGWYGRGGPTRRYDVRVSWTEPEV